MPFHNTPRIGALACLEVKMIGKPYAGELHVRFEEGEQDFVSRTIPKWARSWKRRKQPRSVLTNAVPVLYSTADATLSVILAGSTYPIHRCCCSCVGI